MNIHKHVCMCRVYKIKNFIYLGVDYCTTAVYYTPIFLLCMYRPKLEKKETQYLPHATTFMHSVCWARA